MRPFQTVLRDAARHGILAGVSLPGTGEPVPTDILDCLHPAERDLAVGMRGYRQESFVGGRLAAQAALRTLGRRLGPVLAEPRGAPIAPRGTVVSISHKRDLAVALAARRGNGFIGLDLEDLQPPRPGIETKVLTANEMQAMRALPEDRQWTATIVRFSIKEAIYKALAPHLQRYIDFHEAEVTPLVDGTAQVRLALLDGGGPSDIEATYSWHDQSVLATVRVRW